MNANDVSKLLFNPLWTKSLIHYFLSGAHETKNRKIKFELIYLALPFIYNDIVFKKLTKCSIKSSFSSLFDNPELKNQLVSKYTTIAAYKQITDQSLMCLNNIVEFSQDGFIYILEPISYRKCNDNDLRRDYFKAAFNWGLILAKEDHKNILLNLG